MSFEVKGTTVSWINKPMKVEDDVRPQIYNSNSTQQTRTLATWWHQGALMPHNMCVANAGDEEAMSTGQEKRLACEAPIIEG